MYRGSGLGSNPIAFITTILKHIIDHNDPRSEDTWGSQSQKCRQVCFNMVVYFSKEYHNETKIQNPKDYGGMVKWLSQQTFNLPVQGSNPRGPTI